MSGKTEVLRTTRTRTAASMLGSSMAAGTTCKKPAGCEVRDDETAPADEAPPVQKKSRVQLVERLRMDMPDVDASFEEEFGL